MRSVTLADGPHLLHAPTVADFIFLQQLGYPLVGMFAAHLRITQEVETDENGEPVTDEDGDIVARVEPNLQAIADHLCTLLIRAEPERDWTPEKVADAMVLSEVPAYYAALRELGDEGSGGVDPKASSPTTPPSEQSEPPA